MKRTLLAAAPLAGMALLLAFSRTALTAAKTAVTVFFTGVLPALLPFYVLSSLLLSSGALAALSARVRSRVLPCWALGAAAGFPVGARLCDRAGQADRAALCNLCSPAFLLGVVAQELCGNVQLFFPLAIAHYGSGLLLLSVLAAFRGRKAGVAANASVEAEASAPAPAGLFPAISDGMHAMLRILGCMVFFSVASAVGNAALRLDRAPGAAAAVSAFFEITAGCRAAALLPLPSRALAALLAAAVSFGGLCVLAQAKLLAPAMPVKPYLLQKLLQAALSALLAYWITPYFVPEQLSVFSDCAERYAGNALLGGAYLYTGFTALSAVWLTMECIKKARSRAPGRTVRRTERRAINNRPLRPRHRRHPR